MRCTRWEYGNETSWSQTLKNWTWTHLNSTSEGSMQRKCWRPWVLKSWYSQSQMERKHFLEEIMFRDHPLWTGIAQTEEKNKEILKENQTDLLQPFFKTHHRMIAKLEMICGPFQTILHIVITWTAKTSFDVVLEKISTIIGTLKKTRQNTLVLLKPMNLWRIRLEGVPHRYHEDTLQEKGRIHWVMTVWCTNLFLSFKKWKHQMQRQLRTKWEKLKQIPGWQLTKVINKKRGDRWSNEWRQKSGKAPNCKGRIVLRGDIVKDDFGFCAVFTEQRSSAS